MRPIVCSSLYLTLLLNSAYGQATSYPYVLKTFAGAFPLGDGGAATSALLYYPTTALPDSGGNLYILDSQNYRIRKVTPTGAISTFAQISIYGSDMKFAADGSLYVVGSAEVIKVSPSGVSTIVAGTGTYGYSGDGGPATAAQVGSAYGVALDSAGNIYFSDTYSNGCRVRMITAKDGKIQTIAGTSNYGFNGDGQLATSSNLYFPQGVAVDSSGNIYVADAYNYRIRKFTVGGTISTIAGTGTYGQPKNGPATASPLGYPAGLYLDASNNLYATDDSYEVVLKMTPDGTLTRIAGNFNAYGSPGDGAATGVSLLSPLNIGGDASGSLYFPDATHLVRKLTTAGNLTTVAGMVHYGGDNGPAVSALLNQPSDAALDGQGNVFIADAYNFRIRKVTSNGTIGTYAGRGIPGTPSNGSSAVNAQIPYIYAMASDSKGALYLATYYQILKLTPDGIISVVAGTGAYGNSGDGGPATAATFEGATGVAVDSAGNVYVADCNANRVRMITAATGVIAPYAGTGAVGRTGDGGLATSARLYLYFYTPLAVDAQGNLYIGDGYNYSVRMVTPAGIISTVVGNNGAFGRPDGVQATSAGFSIPASMAFDSAGNLFIASRSYGDIYKLSGGTIRRISGITTGTSSLADGTPALSAYFFSQGIKVDQNGDIYAVDGSNNTVRKLILNSPAAFTIADGNNQTGQAGQSLSKVLKVQVNGRSGFGVSGVPVTFAVTSGSATLSTPTSQTDSNGVAGVGVTLGATSGPVTITASVAGTSLAPLQFSETVAPACNVPQPVISSVTSASDFGGSKIFAPGSWLEIKGTNLAQTTRLWGQADFSGSSAPVTIDGVSVSIDGKSAYVEYVSPGQVNVQAPSDTATGSLQLTVTTSSCTSAAANVQEAAIAPGLLAPASFDIGGTQYLVAQFPDQTYVGNANLIPGAPFRPAAPGDTLTVYGIGFGSVSPATAPGVIAAGSTNIPGLSISFGTSPAQIVYAGLAPGAVGEYQFVFVVPNVPDGDYPIVVQAGGTQVPQSVYLTVHK